MKFATTERGSISHCIGNIVAVLTSKQWDGVVAFDEFLQNVIFCRSPPLMTKGNKANRVQNWTKVGGEWTDEDTTRLSTYMAFEHQLFVSTTQLNDALYEVSKKHPCNQVRDYFDKLVWDGENRLEKLFPYYFRGPDNEYTHGIAKCWMVSAVARTYQPGCQCDYLVVLQGLQGKGKTSGLRALVKKEWFSETAIDIGSKEGVQALRGKLCICFDELDSIKGKARIEKIKNFLTRTVDNIRIQYKSRTIDLDRRVVFCGTTNEEAFLTDQTGNRRFLPVTVGSNIQVKEIERDRDQLWAEATALYKTGFQYWPDESLTLLCEDVQTEHTVAHPWLERVAFHVGQKEGLWARGGTISTGEILTECIEKPVAQWGTQDHQNISNILKSLGFSKYRSNGLSRYRKTGVEGGSATKPALKLLPRNR